MNAAGKATIAAAFGVDDTPIAYRFKDGKKYSFPGSIGRFW